MQDKLIVFDTTLRDGEQSPGASMTKDEKLRIAKALEKMHVDIIEAGFPIASHGDFEAVKSVSELITESTVCGLARALDKDIDCAADALKPAKSFRIHTFLATSPIHMREKLRMEPEQVIDNAVKAVKRAGKYTDNIEFSPEDAGRSEFDFLCRVIESVICKRLIAASSSIDLSILEGAWCCWSLPRFCIKLSAAFSMSFGFSFQDCASCLQRLPNPGLPYESSAGKYVPT
mgnify:CR=1 FL=1